QTAGVFAPAPQQPRPANPAPGMHMPGMSANEQAKIKAEMAKLSPEDRRLAETQFFCAVDQDSPLGTMGPIHKVMIKDQPVFLCCKGCVAEAKVHPEDTLAQFQKLMSRMAPKK